MISKKDIKDIKALSSKKFRDETALFVVEGEKLVEEARASGFDIVSIFRKEDIGEEAMGRISQLSSPSPVLAVVRQRPAGVIPAKLDNGLYLALDSIRDPGNLGTIIRIADWFGIRKIFASRDTVEVYNPKVVQATMGAIFRVEVVYTDLVPFAGGVIRQGGQVYGTFLDGQNIYGRPLDAGDDSPVVIVIGNESNGISPVMAALVTDRLFIPPYPGDSATSESLNAAVACSITVSEFRRRLWEKL